MELTNYLIFLIANLVCFTIGNYQEYRVDTHESLPLYHINRFRRAADSNTTSSTSTANNTQPTSTTPSTSTYKSSRQTTKLVKEKFSGQILEEKDHDYYHIYVRNDKEHFDSLWKDLKYLEKKQKAVRHPKLSNNHRLAATIKINFPFRFYGHEVDNVTIATGGFLYMSPYLHRFLTATQYIAPLMANFDTSASDDSHVYYYQKGKQALYIEWRDIHLRDQKSAGKFTFQVILYSDDSIAFVYKEIPLDAMKISSFNHPVKIGLSDAFYVNVDKNLKKLGRYQPTIFEYHSVKIKRSQLKSGIVINFRPYPTCNTNKECSKCIAKGQKFKCRWCSATGKCSNGFDWHRHEWMLKNCHYNAYKAYCPGDFTTQFRTFHRLYGTRTYNVKGIITKTEKTTIVQGWVIAIVVVLLLSALIASVVGWIFYAYTHPTSRSGLWLIKHRPSQMKETFSKMKFWKRGAGSQERYGVESTA